MKRWVWLGLLGCAAACNDAHEPYPPASARDSDCASASGQALPPEERSWEAVGRDAEAPVSTADGREPFLVRYRRAVPTALAARTATDAVTRAGGQVTVRWSHLDAVAARLTPEQRMALDQDPDVLSIERDGRVHAFARQALAVTGSVGEYTEGLQQVQAPRVWDADNDGVLDAAAPNGSGIKVCVIDSGWDHRHPELQAAYAGGKDFVDGDDEPLDFDRHIGKWGSGHGTHTAATIAAQLGAHGTVEPGEEPNGVVGVAPGVELLVARVLNLRGQGNDSAIISALAWCQQQGARIASLSLGTPNRSALVKEAVTHAVDAGMLVIAASGNSGTGDSATEPHISYPAAFDGVVAVGAVSFNGERPSFSQVGPQLSLVAPGVGVLSATVLQGASYSQVAVDGRTIESHSVAFAPVGQYSGKVLVCGLGDSLDACGREATCDGFVAYVDHGGLDETGYRLSSARKVTNLRRAGARAVIIGNDDPSQGTGAFGLHGEGTWVPAASVSHVSGSTIKGLEGREATVHIIGVDYERLEGTSMAAPHVSGVAALLWSARPTLTAAQVRQLLEDSAQDLGLAGRDNTFGFGLVQAKRALDLLQTRYPRP
ncbi:S8 family serine peptidase [Hyalangium sp.]|uniref:S8 family serine peptidase n=1 Tax=Hyalangium sp. TaxID=2028555 RepID=UPI002D7073D6|nr:S8 family serine peptidase [Hyalangium sp.]HYH98466.1 S8 family serine peptidase [Hyalangium sp.]